MNVLSRLRARAERSIRERFEVAAPHGVGDAALVALLGKALASGGVLIPVHWGTFDLALHPWTEPQRRSLQPDGSG